MTGDPRPTGPATDVQWRKSSFSSIGNCVEVATVDPEGVALRNSRDPGGPVVYFTAPEWAAFLLGVKNAEFDQS